jgi:hypothetical protein
MRSLVVAHGTGIEQTLYDIRRQVLLMRTEIRLLQSQCQLLDPSKAKAMIADLEDGEIVMEFLSRSAMAAHLGDILELRRATKTLLDEIRVLSAD